MYQAILTYGMVTGAKIPCDSLCQSIDLSGMLLLKLKLCDFRKIKFQISIRVYLLANNYQIPNKLLATYNVSAWEDKNSKQDSYA